MIIDFHNLNGGGGGVGPQGPQGPIGPQGPQGEDGINQDPTRLKSVSELPESGETGEVVALSSETGETITFNTADVVFGEGEDILEISGDGLRTITANAFYDEDNQVNVLKFAIGMEEDYLVEDGSSVMFPASTDDELIWEWIAELNDGVVTIKLYDSNNDEYLPLSTSNISLNVCGAKVNGTFVGVYQYDGLEWNKVGENGGEQLPVECPDVQLLLDICDGEADVAVRLRDAAGNLLGNFSTSNDPYSIYFEGEYAGGLYQIEFEGEWGGENIHFIYDCEGTYESGVYNITKAFDKISIDLIYDEDSGEYNIEFNINYVGGEGGDSHILKASSSIPSGLTLGDVYALASGDTEWNLIDGDIPEGTKLVKVQVVNEGTYTFYWSDFDYVGIDYSGGSFSNLDGMNADGENKWSIINASGSVEYDGEYLVATLTGDESWKSVDGNSVGGDKYYGEKKQGGLFQHIAGGDKKFLTADNLPENRLVPEGGSEGEVIMKNSDDTSGWATIRQVPFTDMAKDYTGYMLGAKSGWADEIGWIPVTEMYPVEEGLVGSVPLQGGDGKVYSRMNDNGEYEIVQAQGEETVVRADDDWVPLDYTNDWSKVTGFTELRIHDSSEAAYFDFRFGGIECNIRYENGEWSSDSITVSSTAGEFTDAYVNDDSSITLSCTKNGGYLVITFSTPVDGVSCGSEDGSSGAEVNNLPITKFANAVTSFDIRKIVKISQSDYDDLVNNGEVDEHTLYIIISSI
jgi:hypothetical protein